MSGNIELSVVYPAYNEEDNVKLIPKELLHYLDALKLNYEVIIVDDGCKDNTVIEVKKLQKKYAAVRLVQHPKNLGLGMAVRTGIKSSRGKLVVTIDGDFTFHPKQIKSLINAYKKYDVDFVIGSPTLAGYDKTVPFYRIFLSRSVNTLYSILLGKWITSISPIFRLYQGKDLKKLKLETTKFDINAEILYKLISIKKTFIEIPAKLTVRKHGVSKLNNMKEIKNHIKLLTKIMVWKIRRE